MRQIITISGLLLSLLFIREISLLPDGKLHLYLFDVDQGDAIFLVTPSGKQIVIDGGPNLTALEHLGTHMPFQIDIFEERLWLRARAPQRTRATRRPAERRTDMAMRRARSQAIAAMGGVPLRTG